MRTVIVLTALSVAVLAAPSAATAATDYDPDRTPFPVPSIVGEIAVDGVIDEPAWEHALTLRLAYEQRPGENTEPPVETTVLLAHGESHVYAAFLCRDPDPGEIRAHYTDRDKIWADDWVLLVLDTFNSEREAYNFACNPLGIQGDTYECPHGESEAWDAIWDSAGRITSDGYQVEMAIPFSSLRFQRAEGEQIWGFDVARSHPRSVTHRLGSFPVDRDSECYACQYSKLVGFEGATPGRNVELVPTLTALATQEREDWTEGSFQDPETDGEAGLTARWGITPNMRLTATANPDFSQVEADAKQLDVNTQYALSYDEKRPFFLEGADIFQDRLGAVHTRTIADPTWGAKLTGREGSHTAGAFVARDEITNLIIPAAEGSSETSLDTESTAAALRYRLDLGRSSGIGVLATSREATDYYNRTIGVDGFLRFLKSERIDFQLLGSATKYPKAIRKAYDQPSGELRDVGVDVTFNHRSEDVNGYLHHRTIGEDYRTDLGFRPHVGERHTCTGLARNWRREAGSWFTLFEIGVTYSETRFLDGDIQWQSPGVFIDYGGPLQSRLYVRPDVTTEVLEGKEYNSTALTVVGEIQPSSLLGLRLEAIVGEGVDYDNNRKGDGLHAKPGVRLRLNRHLDVSLSHNYSRMDVEGGRLYTTNISYLKAVYQFTSRAFLRAIVQYVDYDLTPRLYVDPVNSERRSVSSQLLFSYKINPRTVFYLGYSDRFYGDQDTRLTQTDRTLFAKIGYAWVL